MLAESRGSGREETTLRREFAKREVSPLPTSASARFPICQRGVQRVGCRFPMMTTIQLHNNRWNWKFPSSRPGRASSSLASTRRAVCCSIARFHSARRRWAFPSFKFPRRRFALPTTNSTPRRASRRSFSRPATAGLSLLSALSLADIFRSAAASRHSSDPRST